MQAASQCTLKHISVLNLWKKGGVVELGSDCKLMKSASIVCQWSAVKDLSNRGKPLRIFLKVIASGSESVASICSYHIHLSVDEGALMLRLMLFANERLCYFSHKGIIM